MADEVFLSQIIEKAKEKFQKICKEILKGSLKSIV